MDAAVDNAGQQATLFATTFQTPFAIFLGVILFSIACAIAIAMFKRSHSTASTEEKGAKAGRDYEYIYKDGRIAGARKK